MLLFPQPTFVDEFGSGEGETPVRCENVQEHNEEEKGWNTVFLRRSRSASRERGSTHRNGKSFENVVRGNRT
ncbi:hypothetical protein ACFX13_019605 [Malus domestica]